jgi:hypothetical protein
LGSRISLFQIEDNILLNLFRQPLIHSLVSLRVIFLGKKWRVRKHMHLHERHTQPCDYSRGDLCCFGNVACGKVETQLGQSYLLLSSKDSSPKNSLIESKRVYPSMEY